MTSAFTALVRKAIVRHFVLFAAVLLLTSGAVAQDSDSLFIIVYHQGPAWKGSPAREQPAMKSHGAYMKRLFAEGHIFAAGPTSDTPGGHVIVHAHNLDEAKALMAADPSVTSGMFTGEVHGWTPVFRSEKPLPQTP